VAARNAVPVPFFGGCGAGGVPRFWLAVFGISLVDAAELVVLRQSHAARTGEVRQARRSAPAWRRFYRGQSGHCAPGPPQQRTDRPAKCGPIVGGAAGSGGGITAVSVDSSRDTDKLALALTWYEAGLDFADALHLAQAVHCEQLLTFDRRFVNQAQQIQSCPVKMVE
jgi:hypothetical protein